MTDHLPGGSAPGDEGSGPGIQAGEAAEEKPIF